MYEYNVVGTRCRFIWMDERNKLIHWICHIGEFPVDLFCDLHYSLSLNWERNGPHRGGGEEHVEMRNLSTRRMTMFCE